LHATYRCMLIGWGRRSIDDHVPALVSPAHNIKLVAVCDINPGKEEEMRKVLEAYPIKTTPKFYTNLNEALEKERIDFAIIATPHGTHLEISEELLKRKIPFLKEKPFAISLQEARKLVSLIEKYSGHMRLCVQRHYHPLYTYGKKALPYVGTIRHFAARYQLNADRYYFGWRSRPETAGGGAVIDMGYHIIDLIYWYFGVPSSIYAVAAPKKDEHVDYNVEETVLSALAYENGVVGSMFLSLCEPDKYEDLRVYGTHGYIHLQRDFLKRYDTKDTLIESLTREPAWPSAVTDVLFDFIGNLNNRDIVREECMRGLEVMSIIESIYKSMEKKLPVNPREI
jgi:predicted dehydrogenase